MRLMDPDSSINDLSSSQMRPAANGKASTDKPTLAPHDTEHKALCSVSLSSYGCHAQLVAANIANVSNVASECIVLPQ